MKIGLRTVFSIWDIFTIGCMPSGGNAVLPGKYMGFPAFENILCNKI